ncbi:hypothetical protein [Vulgatibacter incomptus]|nr:hypothetical protein [Vulgatibacter incomptus]
MLHRAAIQATDEILQRRGLGYFLEKTGAFPFALSEQRCAVVIEVARRRSGASRSQRADASLRMVRRRLIALVAEAMVRVGY